MNNEHKYRDGEPCKHPGCLSHISHPCEECGRIAGYSILIPPEPVSPPEKRWYHKYPQLNSALFTWENSGQYTGEAPPFRKRIVSDEVLLDIVGEWGMEQVYRIVGYTESPPFPAKGYPSVAIMYENLETFEKTWWHHEMY